MKKELATYWSEFQDLMNWHKYELYEATDSLFRKDFWSEIYEKNKAFPALDKETFPNKARLEEVLEAIDTEYDRTLRRWIAGIDDREQRMRYLIGKIKTHVQDLQLATSPDWLKVPSVNQEEEEEEEEEEKEVEKEKEKGVVELVNRK